MKHKAKDKEDLVAEVARLRQRVSKLEQDEIERMRSGELIRESEERYRRMLNAVTTYTYSVEVSEGRAISTQHSKACLSITGYSEEDYQRDPYLWYAMIHPADRSMVEKAVNEILGGLEVSPVEHRLIRRDGRTIWVRNTMVPYRDEQGRLTRYDGVVEDITGRKQTEDHILYGQKMESLGRMAGAIAHNFNNIMAIILGYAEMIQMGLSPDSSILPKIGHIIDACRRAQTITTQVVAYTGHMRLTLGPEELSELISGMAPLLEASIREEITLDCNLAPDLPLINVDAGQIRQMLISLFTNAVEAIGEKPGHIFMKTGVMEADADFLNEPQIEKELQEGRYVTLEIKDDGCGMDENVKTRMFDPFFSTKFLGRGLGLPAVLGIVRRHGGFIKARSEPGSGAAFLVGFPVIKQNSEDVP
jgi:PAS domain S-box-containing protein